jgi:hypothetical protein
MKVTFERHMNGNFMRVRVCEYILDKVSHDCVESSWLLQFFFLLPCMALASHNHGHDFGMHVSAHEPFLQILMSKCPDGQSLPGTRGCCLTS